MGNGVKQIVAARGLDSGLRRISLLGMGEKAETTAGLK